MPEKIHACGSTPKLKLVWPIRAAQLRPQARPDANQDTRSPSWSFVVWRRDGLQSRGSLCRISIARNISSRTWAYPAVTAVLGLMMAGIWDLNCAARCRHWLLCWSTYKYSKKEGPGPAAMKEEVLSRRSSGVARHPRPLRGASSMAASDLPA